LFPSLKSLASLYQHGMVKRNGYKNGYAKNVFK